MWEATFQHPNQDVSASSDKETLHLELYKETAVFRNPLITIAASRHLGLYNLLVCVVVHTVVFPFI
jgi:hypothetical protein